MHVNIGYDAGARVLIFRRTRKSLRTGDAKIRIFECGETRNVEALEDLIRGVFRRGVEGASARERGTAEEILLEDLAAGFRGGHLTEAGDAEADEFAVGALVGESHTALIDPGTGGSVIGRDVEIVELIGGPELAGG